MCESFDWAKEWQIFTQTRQRPFFRAALAIFFLNKVKMPVTSGVFRVRMLYFEEKCTEKELTPCAVC
jgi:hypothetical protein